MIRLLAGEAICHKITRHFVTYTFSSVRPVFMQPPFLPALRLPLLFAILPGLPRRQVLSAIKVRKFHAYKIAYRLIF